MKITVSALVHKDVETVWNAYNQPKHVIHWNFASDTWHCPNASNHFVIGGSFSYRMEAKDGSAGFDFEGIYDVIDSLKQMSYHMADHRKVDVFFSSQHGKTKVDVTFDIEMENSPELQKMGWQSILDQFKTYTESL